MIYKFGAVALLGGSLFLGACVPGCGLNLGYNGRGPVGGMQCHPPRGGYGGGMVGGYPGHYRPAPAPVVMMPAPQPVYVMHPPRHVNSGGVWRSPYWW